MTNTKQPMQADGSGHSKLRRDEVDQEAMNGRRGSGDSGGGAYPNPHTNKDDADKARPDSFLGHGGQTEMGYYGPGQLGGKKADRSKKGRVGQGD